MNPPRPCMCGHREIAHQHHRLGLDCSVTGCPCLDYRAATPIRLWLARTRPAVARWRLPARTHRGRLVRAAPPPAPPGKR